MSGDRSHSSRERKQRNQEERPGTGPTIQRMKQVNRFFFFAA